MQYCRCQLTLSQEKKKKIAEILSSNSNEASQIDQVAKVRGWFRPEENSAYYPTIQKCLEDEIDSDTMASQLFEKIDRQIIARKLDDVYFVDLWYSIIHSAKRSSFREPEESGEFGLDFLGKLTALLRAFRDHKVKDHEEYNHLYSSLCDFKMACDESFNDAPEPYASQVEIDAWTNVNFFFARVTAEDLMDLSMYAIWTMRQALEEEQQDDMEGTAAQKYNVYVPAAAAWVLGFGRTLYRKEKDLTPTDRKYGNPARGGALWKGKAEFSKERWALWKERFAAVSKMDEVSEKTRSASKDALQAMERAETYNENPHSVGSRT